MPDGSFDGCECADCQRRRAASLQRDTGPHWESSGPPIERRVTQLESRVRGLTEELAHLEDQLRGISMSRAREQQMNNSITALGREVGRLRAKMEEGQEQVAETVAPPVENPVPGQRARFSLDDVRCLDTNLAAWLVGTAEAATMRWSVEEEPTTWRVSTVGEDVADRDEEQQP